MNAGDHDIGYYPFQVLLVRGLDPLTQEETVSFRNSDFLVLKLSQTPPPLLFTDLQHPFTSEAGEND